MGIPTALRKAREKLGLTQEELAAELCYSPKTVSAIETGRRRLPREARGRLAQMNRQLNMEICAGCEANVFVAPWLDGEVDLSILATTVKLAEELDELADALRHLNLVNKTTAEQLTEQDLKALARARQEAVDVMTGLQVWLVQGTETYGFDLAQDLRMHRAKLTSRRYLRKRRE